jgi:hypothetical protein
MKAPPGISHLQTNKPRTVAIGADGVVELTETEAKPLKGVAGWTRLDNAAASKASKAVES